MPRRYLQMRTNRWEEKNMKRQGHHSLRSRAGDLTKKYAPLAQLRIADTYIQEEEPDRAVDEYKRFIGDLSRSQICVLRPVSGRDDIFQSDRKLGKGIWSRIKGSRRI